jgi:hypothetical protein
VLRSDERIIARPLVRVDEPHDDALKHILFEGTGRES